MKWSMVALLAVGALLILTCDRPRRRPPGVSNRVRTVAGAALFGAGLWLWVFGGVQP